MKTFREIGEELGIDPKTAHSICERALRKMAASPAAAQMRGLVRDSNLARKKPVSTFHAARAHVFARRQA
jgi:DNA-binding NarL/FixJ family response regulator